MTATPPLFDRASLIRHRLRATMTDPFLHLMAATEAQDRVSMVNRTFKNVAIVSPLPAIWEGIFANATCVSDTDSLALPVQSFDLVVHSMCLHWANDPVGQLIQCRRALRPDGLCIAILLGGQTLAELRAALSQAESQVTGGLSPRVAPMADIRDLGTLLQRAGFALPVADSTTTAAVYRDMTHLMHDLRAMGETNAISGRLRHLTRRTVIQRAADIYEDVYPAPSGGIRASFEMITLTGWAPGDNQPKPLRPGTARTRLADALRVPETPLPD